MHVDFLFKIILQFVHVIASRFQKYYRNFPVFNLMNLHLLVLQLFAQTGVWHVTTILLSLLQSMSCRKTLQKRSQIIQSDGNGKSTGG